MNKIKQASDFVFGQDQFGYGTKEKFVLGIGFLFFGATLVIVLNQLF